MNFNDIVKAGSAALGSYASSIPGTSSVRVASSYNAPQQRFFGLSGSQGAGIGLGTLISGYIIGRFFGVVPKLI